MSTPLSAGWKAGPQMTHDERKEAAFGILMNAIREIADQLDLEDPYDKAAKALSSVERLLDKGKVVVKGRKRLKIDSSAS